MTWRQWREENVNRPEAREWQAIQHSLATSNEAITWEFQNRLPCQDYGYNSEYTVGN